MTARLILALIIAFFAALPAGAESFKSWAARGAREEREKDPKAAFSSYSNALSMWEEDDGNAAKAKVLCARAGLREKQGDDEGALTDLSDCLALDKKNAKAFHRRGALRLKARDTQRAIGDFYRAIAIDIRFAQAYADRAAAYERQSELGFAYEDYRQACSLGVKAACPKAKALAPKPAAKGKGKAKPKAAPPRRGRPRGGGSARAGGRPRSGSGPRRRARSGSRARRLAGGARSRREEEALIELRAVPPQVQGLPRGARELRRQRRLVRGVRAPRPQLRRPSGQGLLPRGVPEGVSEIAQPRPQRGRGVPRALHPRRRLRRAPQGSGGGLAPLRNT